jgi:hypothetical protein
METPGDSEEGVRKVRDIRFEFTRMRVEIMYGLQWIEYYLIKYLSGPLSIIENKLKSVNEWLTKNMPTWSDKVAQWIISFIQFGETIGRFCGDVIESMKNVWDSMGDGEKSIAKLSAVFALFKLNPFIMVIVSAMLLIDDFYAYVDGRKSSKTLAPIWKQLIDWFKELKPYLIEFSQWFNNFANVTIKSLNSVLNGLWSILRAIFSEIGKSIEKSGVFTAFRDTLGKVGDALDSIMKGLIQLGKDMGLLSQNTTFASFWSTVGSAIGATAKTVLSFANVLASVGKMVGQLMQHDWSGAWETAKSIPGNWLQDMSNVTGGGNGHGTSRGWGGVNNAWGNRDSGSSSSTGNYDVAIERMANKYGIPVDVFKQLIQIESSGRQFDENGHVLTSSAGCLGLTQLAPGTAAGLGVDPNDPIQNLEGGAKYFAQLAAQYGSYAAAAAGYNGGPDAAQSYLNHGHYGDEGEPYRNFISGLESGQNSPAYQLNNMNAYNGNTGSGTSASLPANVTINVEVSPNASPSQYAEAVKNAYMIVAQQTASFAGVTPNG